MAIQKTHLVQKFYFDRQARIWMMDEEEDQNLECPEDSIECASRQSCVTL
jgi:hypothetical protein